MVSLRKMRKDENLCGVREGFEYTSELCTSTSQGWLPVTRHRYAPRLIWNNEEDAPHSAITRYATMLCTSWNAHPPGLGFFAATDIKKDKFIIAFTGDVISTEEYKNRTRKYKKFPYVYKAGPFYIDATETGNSAKYANYSCNFNMRTEKWQLVGKLEGFVALGFFAERGIKKGEELTIDYNFDEDEHTFFVWNSFVLLFNERMRNVTLAVNEALKDNGNDAKKVCENFGCVVREHKSARPNYELRSQTSIEAHEEKMQAIQKKLKECFDKATTAELKEDLLKEARAFNERP
ncbi:hypothetical protein L3Y34_012953 [Caenorhabditis briggsae]|uniref:SET domain-containing protein n=1 Tax=Caenorhabditis briggsae TaxID=6238 RepID=A0AAE9CX98_CAEBR|nr:hypothetical protein L3Y34_012953 [Caenorhabditis briggsae]